MLVGALIRFPSNAVLLLAFATALGQTPIKPFYIGTVVDALKGLPLVGVEVSVGLPDGAVETTYTDGQGRFMISEATYSRSIGMPNATVSSRAADVSPAGEGRLHRADGRALLEETEGPVPGYRSISGEEVPAKTERQGLVKQALVHGGPLFRFAKDGFVCRASRMRMLALTSSIESFEGAPDFDLVIPLVPLRQEGACAAP